MEEKDISALVKRYQEMLATGRSIYFDAEEFDDLAEYYDSQDDLAQAEVLIKKGLNIHPDNHQLMLKKAKLMMHRGYYNKALDFLNIHFNGYDLDLYLLKIECLLFLDLRAEAFALTEDAIEEEEQEPEALYAELGFLYGENDLYDEAIMYLEKSLEFNSDNEDVLIELSYAYEMKSNFLSAIDTCNRLLDINPYAYDVWVTLGKLHSLQEEFEKAIDAFEFAATINDFDRDVLKLKAHCLSLLGRIDEAISVFKELLLENPSDESLHNSLSECYFSIEQYDEMLYHLDKYEEVRGETIETIAKRALVYLQDKHSDKVVPLIEKGLSIDEDNEDINIVAGEYYFQQENYLLAENFLIKVYESGNRQNSTLLDHLSLICIAKNDIETAIKYTEDLIELSDDIQTRTRLSLLYFEAGDKQIFTSYINSFSDDELRHLVSLFFSKEKFSLDEMSRDDLINRLNDARECRILFKNIAY